MLLNITQVHRSRLYEINCCIPVVCYRNLGLLENFVTITLAVSLFAVSEML